MKYFSLEKNNKLYSITTVFILLAVFFSFWGSSIVLFTISPVGAVFPFRIFTFFASCCYFLCFLFQKENVIGKSSLNEKITYISIVMWILYGIVSCFRAIDASWTLHKLLNFCIDLCFFFMIETLIKNPSLQKKIVFVLSFSLVIVVAMGIWENVNGGIFNNAYDNYKRFIWFDSVLQFPIVTFGNTNDFATGVFMCFAVEVLYFAIHWHELNTIFHYLLVLEFGIMYYVFLSCSARLIIFSYYILLLGFVLFLLFSDRKHLWLLLIIAFCVLFCNFATNYEDYTARFKRGNEANDYIVPSTHGELLVDQFYKQDDDSGELVLRSDNSAGTRAKLLIHSYRCFIESKGLGVGLGNTEQLAKERLIVFDEELNQPIWSIHCFIARSLSDFGVFALIPLCAIAFLILKQAIVAFITGIKNKEMHRSGFACLYIFALITYPIASTASSDAQDIIYMWIFLAFILMTSNKLKDIDSWGGQSSIEE